MKQLQFFLKRRQSLRQQGPGDAGRPGEPRKTKKRPRARVKQSILAVVLGGLAFMEAPSMQLRVQAAPPPRTFLSWAPVPPMGWNSYSTKVPPHGAVLVRISPASEKSKTRG